MKWVEVSVELTHGYYYCYYAALLKLIECLQYATVWVSTGRLLCHVSAIMSYFPFIISHLPIIDTHACLDDGLNK